MIFRLWFINTKTVLLALFLLLQGSLSIASDLDSLLHCLQGQIQTSSNHYALDPPELVEKLKQITDLKVGDKIREMTRILGQTEGLNFVTNLNNSPNAKQTRTMIDTIRTTEALVQSAGFEMPKGLIIRLGADGSMRDQLNLFKRYINISFSPVDVDRMRVSSQVHGDQAIWIHEYAHSIFYEKLNRDPRMQAIEQKSRQQEDEISRLRKVYENEKSTTDRDTNSKRMSELTAKTTMQMQRLQSKVESAVGELFSDLLPAIVLNDPDAIAIAFRAHREHDSLNSTRSQIRQKVSDGMNDARALSIHKDFQGWRSDAQSFAPSESQLKLLANGDPKVLNQLAKPDPHHMLAPVGAWAWKNYLANEASPVQRVKVLKKISDAFKDAVADALSDPSDPGWTNKTEPELNALVKQRIEIQLANKDL